MVREALAVLCANVKGVGDARIDFRGVWTVVICILGSSPSYCSCGVVR